MRQDTGELDLERRTEFQPDPLVAKLEQKGMIACLQTIRVSVLGVDNTGKGIGYWNDLHVFWTVYFRKSGANIEGYSVLRDNPFRLGP